MGAVKSTVQRLTVAKVDVERNLVLVKGSIPGAAGSFVILKETVKPKK
jgi:large subunit ribosomal protein L3